MLFTEIHVGNEIPFSIFLFFVKTFFSSLFISLSPKAQRSVMEALGWHFLINSSRTS